MQKVFENTTNSPMYVAGLMILPGEMRVVEVPDEPEGPVLLPAPPTLADQVADELKKPVAKLLKGLKDGTDDALRMMQALEGQAKKPRTSLVTAIADELIRRADDKLKSDTV